RPPRGMPRERGTSRRNCRAGTTIEQLGMVAAIVAVGSTFLIVGDAVSATLIGEERSHDADSWDSESMGGWSGPTRTADDPFSAALSGSDPSSAGVVADGETPTEAGVPDVGPPAPLDRGYYGDEIFGVSPDVEADPVVVDPPTDEPD